MALDDEIIAKIRSNPEAMAVLEHLCDYHTCSIEEFGGYENFVFMASSSLIQALEVPVTRMFSNRAVETAIRFELTDDGQLLCDFLFK